MKCPNCGETECFEIDLWEVKTFAGDTDGSDVLNARYNDDAWVAIDPQGCTKCDSCSHCAETPEFLDGKESFPVLDPPDPKLPGARLLVAAVLSLLACPDLNLDELEDITHEAIEKARSLVRPVEKGITPTASEKGVAV